MVTRNINRQYRLTCVPAGSNTRIELGLVRNYSPPEFVYDREEPLNGQGARDDIKVALQNPEASWTLDSYYSQLPPAAKLPDSRFCFEDGIVAGQSATPTRTKHWEYMRGEISQTQRVAGDPAALATYNVVLRPRQYLALDQVAGESEATVLEAVDLNNGIHSVAAAAAVTMDPPTVAEFGVTTIATAAGLTGMRAVLGPDALGSEPTALLQ